MAKKKYIDVYKCREDFYNDVLSILSDDATNDRANEIIDVFDSLSTSDVQEVRHGKWETIIDADGQIEGWLHKKCGRQVTSKDEYCPDCGARMDGEEE